MKTILKLLTLLGAVALFAGCATPAARIEKNPEIFNRLTPDQQALIRAGKVGVGFDKDMVRLALGEPDRVLERTDRSGKREVWKYVTYEGADGMILYTGGFHRYWGASFYPYYMNAPNYHVRSNATVVLDGNGRVVMFEESQ